MIDRAKALIARHEGFRTRTYLDTVGIATVGYGRNLIDRGLSRKEVEKLLTLVDLPRELADEMLESDVRGAVAELRARLEWFDTLDEVRQVALVDMAVNLGISRLIMFRATLTALRLHQWERAAAEMIDSLWAKQVPGRAAEIAGMIRTGKFPEPA